MGSSFSKTSITGRNGLRKSASVSTYPHRIRRHPGCGIGRGEWNYETGNQAFSIHLRFLTVRWELVDVASILVVCSPHGVSPFPKVRRCPLDSGKENVLRDVADGPKIERHLTFDEVLRLLGASSGRCVLSSPQTSAVEQPLRQGLGILARPNDSVSRGRWVSGKRRRSFADSGMRCLRTHY